MIIGRGMDAYVVGAPNSFPWHSHQAWGSILVRDSYGLRILLTPHQLLDHDHDQEGPTLTASYAAQLI